MFWLCEHSLLFKKNQELTTCPEALETTSSTPQRTLSLPLIYRLPNKNGTQILVTTKEQNQTIKIVKQYNLC